MFRVVQWATGPVGRHALAATVDHPDLEVAAALVYSEDKAGRDAGDVCGIGPIGVTTTTDKDEIVAADADCVLHMAKGGLDTLDDICALLASGKNVISTVLTGLIYPPSMGQEVVDRLEGACAEGGSTFHGTGIEPGWASEVLPLAMSGLFRYVESLQIEERLNYSSYDNAAVLFDAMGFGRAPDADVPGRDPTLLGSAFQASLMLLAEGLGATIQDWEFDRQVALADEPFEVLAGRVEAGTVSAMRFSAAAVIDGRPALKVEHITRLGENQAPDWPTGRGWRVTVEGLPSMVLESKIAIHGEDENDQGCLGTAMHAVHAVVPVCEAEPGVKTFLDLPTIMGRHALRRPTTDSP